MKQPTFRASLRKLEQIPHLQSKVNAVSDVINNRPRALRKYDQIYMKVADIVLQAELIQEFVEDKIVVFVGDGDAMALTLAYLSSLDLLRGPRQCVVLDFDERIVNSIAQFKVEYDLENSIEAYLYNVIDPVPKQLLETADFFYTNPPYGSANNGRSILVFMDRCLEVCKKNSGGCVIIPYDHNFEWSTKNMYEIQKYALERGLVVSEMLRNIHSYHLDDNPNLLSSVVIFDRIHSHSTQFQNTLIPTDELQNFYGRSGTHVPRYIRERDPKETNYFEDTDWPQEAGGKE